MFNALENQTNSDYFEQLESLKLPMDKIVYWTKLATVAPEFFTFSKKIPSRRIGRNLYTK
jgi:hypothetical protein